MLETDLKILLLKSVISRKQYRTLMGLRLSDTEALLNELLGQNWIDPVEEKEVRSLLEASAGSPLPQSRGQHMQNILEQAHRVAASDTTVLLLGESGVGKSRLARLIHENSPRRQEAFVTVSCGSIPETLLESELFGAEKGAYTGAVRSREGRFQLAHNGTLFLDEIGEIPPHVQVKLLRSIQEKRIEPLGGEKEIEVNVRLVAATNRNLEEAVKSGQFRQDLFFRLNVIPLTLPPLRERPEDLPDLIAYFLERLGQKNNVAYSLPETLRQQLLGYAWPGNIRELENCLERLAVLSSEGHLISENLPPSIRSSSPEKPFQAPAQNQLNLPEMERQHIIKALQEARGNASKAAHLLGIHRNSLSRKIKQMGLLLKSFRKR